MMMSAFGVEDNRISKVDNRPLRDQLRYLPGATPRHRGGPDGGTSRFGAPKQGGKHYAPDGVADAVHIGDHFPPPVTPSFQPAAEAPRLRRLTGGRAAVIGTAAAGGGAGAAYLLHRRKKKPPQ